MNTSLFEKLHEQDLVSAASLEKIKAGETKKLFSLHWEITTILYTGVLLFTTGISVLVYKNIDSIGHQVILTVIALACAGSFMYCLKKKLPFSTAKVEAPDIAFDYILLLACLLFVTFIGYIQFQYNVFGNRFGLVTFIPMVVLFFCAYFFDHLGILSLAITNLCAWAGITVTPLRILQANDFNSDTIIVTGIILGVGIMVAGILTRVNLFKKHFAFTYTNFGMNLLFISIVAAMFQFENMYLPWFLALTAITYYFYTEAKRARSFYILLMITLYFYTGLCYVVLRLLFALIPDITGIYLACFYFIGSAVVLIRFLVKMNKKIKSA